MRRGTTPTHVFTLPFPTNAVSEVLICYYQRDQPVLEKRTADCTFEGNDITLTLTQEETLKFDSKALIQIQLRVLTTEGVALATEIYCTAAGRVLNDEVMYDTIQGEI